MADHPLPAVLVLLATLYLSGFLHEVGHCVVGRLVGYTPTSLGMGTGRPFLVFNWRGTRVFFGRTRPLQGLIFFFHSGILPRRSAAAWAMAGGILAHLLLVGVLYGLSRSAPSGNWIWLPAMTLNGLLAAVNLVPLSIRLGNAVLRSDGAQILMHLRHGMVETPAPVRAQTVELLRPLWTEIGDSLGLFGHLMAAALAWGELRVFSRAYRYYEDAKALPLEETPFHMAYSEFVGAVLHRQAGRLEEAQDAHARATAGFRALDHAVGLFLMEIAEGELHLLRGESSEAAAILDRLACHPEVVQRPALGAALLTSRLCAHLDAESGQVESLLKEWERVRRRYPSLVRDRSVFGVLGEVRRRQGRLVEAADAYARLLQTLQEMHRGLVGLAGAADFAANHAEMVAEAQRALNEAGRDPSLADPETLFPNPEQLLAQETARREAQNRRRHRIGFWWGVANLLLSPVVFITAALLGRPADPNERVGGAALAFAMLGVLLGLCGLLVILYGVVMQIAARRFPGVRSGGGQRTLFLAMLPWVTWVLIHVAPKD